MPRIIIAVKGGAGSGNWGHTGRPGLVGGSGGGVGLAVGMAADWYKPPKLKHDVVLYLSEQGQGDTSVMAEELGLQYDLRAFERDNRRWTQQAEVGAKEDIHGWLTSGTGVRELTLYDDWSAGRSDLSFGKWLDTPQTYYRGGGRSDVFMSFAHSERVALDASKAASVFTMTLKPSQLLGSGMTGAGEVYVDSDVLEYIEPAALKQFKVSGKNFMLVCVGVEDA